MSSKLKRKLSSANRSVSPPAVCRKTSRTSNTSKVSTAGLKRTTSDPASVITIFSWNVNGVDQLLQKRISFAADVAYPLRESLKRHRWPHILCLQEVKISARDEATQRQLQHAANAYAGLDEPRYTVRFSLPRDRYNATGFGGKVHGVATLIRNDAVPFVEQTRKPDWDLEGRVLIHEMPQHRLVVINGYWVNGTSNPYRNPTTGAIQGTRHDHKLRFHMHMLAETIAIAQQNKHVVLIGDMNVAPQRIDGHPNLRTSPAQHMHNRADFIARFLAPAKPAAAPSSSQCEDIHTPTDKFTNGLHAVDVFRSIHPSLRKYTYFPRTCAWGTSCDRVDNIIMTRPLFEAGGVIETDICDNKTDREHSDHVPIWVTIDLEASRQCIIEPLT